MTVAEYLIIESGNALKASKLQAMQELLNGQQANGQRLFWSEVEQLARQEKIRQPIFDQLMFPVLAQQIANHNIKAIKLLLQLISYTHRSQNPDVRVQHNYHDLLQFGLQIAPDDVELLRMRQESQRRYFEHTIHEVPWGVLYDMNGASIAQCEELLETLPAFASLSQRLGLDESALIRQCRYYYQSYAEYLRKRSAYPDFVSYLTAHPA